MVSSSLNYEGKRASGSIDWIVRLDIQSFWYLIV